MHPEFLIPGVCCLAQGGKLVSSPTCFVKLASKVFQLVGGSATQLPQHFWVGTEKTGPSMALIQGGKAQEGYRQWFGVSSRLYARIKGKKL